MRKAGLTYGVWAATSSARCIATNGGNSSSRPRPCRSHEVIACGDANRREVLAKDGQTRGRRARRARRSDRGRRRSLCRCQSDSPRTARTCRLTEAGEARASWDRGSASSERNPNELVADGLQGPLRRCMMVAAAIRSPRSTITRGTTWCWRPVATSSGRDGTAGSWRLAFRRYGLAAGDADGRRSALERSRRRALHRLQRLADAARHQGPARSPTPSADAGQGGTLPPHPQGGGHQRARASAISATASVPSIKWRPRYNHERPHRGARHGDAGRALSAEPAPLSRTILPPIEYAPGDQVRKVEQRRLHQLQRTEPWRLSKAFRGELRRASPDDRGWSSSDVHYCAHHIASPRPAPERRARTCGLVDNAETRCPQGPQDQQQQQQPDLDR